MEIEPFVEIHRNKWTELRDLYRNNWPDGAVPYCLVDTHISYPDLTDSFNFRIFALEGDITNGMVAIWGQDSYFEIMIHPLKSIDKIEEALATTKVIDWNRNLYVASANPDVVESLKRLSCLLNITLEIEGNGAYKHLLDWNTEPFEISGCPPNTYTENLRSEHLHVVDKTWTFYSERSYKFFETLARNHLCYVLYSEKDDSPLAWVTISCEGSLTHLYCLEEHRRKGYAEFILKFAVNDQLKKGKVVLGYTLQKNEKAQKLFDKLNFKRIGFDIWIGIIKNPKI